MSEHDESGGSYEADDADLSVDQDPSAASEPERVRTGVDAVDAVIDSVDGLRERPLAEHPPVFEAAHERLRRALDPAAEAPDAPESP